MAFSKKEKGTLTLNIDAIPGLRESIGNLYKTPAPQKVSWSYDSTEVLSEHIARRMKQTPVQLTIGELIELFQSQAILGFNWKIQEAISRLDMTEGLAGHTARKIKRRPIQLTIGEVLGLIHGRANPRIRTVQDDKTGVLCDHICQRMMGEHFEMKIGEIIELWHRGAVQSPYFDSLVSNVHMMFGEIQNRMFCS